MASASTPGSVEIKMHVDFGRVLHSMVEVCPGDEVFSEQPILISLEDPTEGEERILRRTSEQTGMNLIDDFVSLKAYAQATPEKKAQVLDCYIPPSLEVSQSKLLTSLMRVVDVCRLFDWGKPIPKEELDKVFLAKACNAHGYHAHNSSTAALFTLGSKIRHSCRPNVMYTSQRRQDGRGSFVAKTLIHPGDELCISYIDIFASCPMRADTLKENYLFTCQCEACTVLVDRYRGLPCPTCATGQIFRTQLTGVWRCESCPAVEFVDSQLHSIIAAESALADQWKLLDQGFGSLAPLMHATEFTLGHSHAITKLCQKKYIEETLLPNLTLAAIPELIRITDSILAWADNDPSVLDSLLIESACAIARTKGFIDYKVPLRYLSMIHEDMLLTFGTSSHTMISIVERAIKACESGKKKMVPNLTTGSSPPQCPMQ
jgi:ribosomal protein L37AE/L43A